MADEVEGTSVESSEVDEFKEAFDTAVSIGDAPDLSTKDDPANEVPETPTEPVTPVVEAQTPLETPAETPPADIPQKAGESDETYEQRWKTLQGIHRHDREVWAAEKAELEAKLAKPEKKEEPKVEAAVSADLYGSLTEEEKAALKEYDEEFDVVSKMEGKKREVELNKLRKEFQSWKDEVTAQLAPATALVQESQVEREKRVNLAHFEAIRKGHEDFEKYRDDGSILKWIEAKPKYLKDAMLNTYAKGAAEEVVELISDFKAENNIQPSQTNVVNIDTRKAERKQAMTAVTTRRGAVNPAMSVRNDFEGAFDEAVNKGG
jgi:hypothetical protein